MGVILGARSAAGVDVVTALQVSMHASWGMPKLGAATVPEGASKAPTRLGGVGGQRGSAATAVSVRASAEVLPTMRLSVPVAMGERRAGRRFGRL